QNLALNPILVTALNPIIGYEKAAEIAKMSIAQGRNIVDVALEMTDIDEHTLRKIMDPFLLTQREPEGKR
ncbi:MAG: fumarate hydratase class II, partial [Gammaproteobacteria bacterium]